MITFPPINTSTFSYTSSHHILTPHPHIIHSHITHSHQHPHHILLSHHTLTSSLILFSCFFHSTPLHSTTTASIAFGCQDLCKKLLVREIQNRLGNQRGMLSFSRPPIQAIYSPSSSAMLTSRLYSLSHTPLFDILSFTSPLNSRPNPNPHTSNSLMVIK